MLDHIFINADHHSIGHTLVMFFYPGVRFSRSLDFAGATQTMLLRHVNIDAGFRNVPLGGTSASASYTSCLVIAVDATHIGTMTYTLHTNTIAYVSSIDTTAYTPYISITLCNL